MDNENRTITVYTTQTDQVVEIIREQGSYYVDLDKVAAKYEAVKEVFLNAYRWYQKKAEQIASRPPAAESAVWTFLNPKYAEKYQGCTVLRLQVPVEAAVFFRMSDWNHILNLRYLGASPEEADAFAEELTRSGIAYEGDIYLKPYYPQFRKRLIKSWDYLFRYDAAIKAGGPIRYEDMQAGLWCIKKEWMSEFGPGHF